MESAFDGLGLLQIRRAPETENSSKTGYGYYCQ